MKGVSVKLLACGGAVLCALGPTPWLALLAVCSFAIAALSAIPKIPCLVLLSILAVFSVGCLRCHRHVSGTVLLVLVAAAGSLQLTRVIEFPEAKLEDHDGARQLWRSVPHIAVIGPEERLPEFFQRMSQVGLAKDHIAHQPALYVPSGKTEGVWRAFQSAARSALREDIPFALILEYDVSFYANWQATLSEAVRAISDRRCVIVQLGGLCFAHGERISPRIRRALCVATEASLYSRTAMQQIVADKDNSSSVIEIDDWLRSEISMCAAEFPIAGQQSEVVNTIGGDKNAPWRSLMEYGWVFLRTNFPYQRYQLGAISLSAAYERLGLQSLWWWAVDAALPSTGNAAPPPHT